MIFKFIKKNNISRETLYTPKGSLILIIFISLVILFFTLPKIYLSNNIYYISKEINRLHTHYSSLKEENKFLIQQLEDAKFKNQITDSLIMHSIETQEETETVEETTETTSEEQ